MEYLQLENKLENRSSPKNGHVSKIYFFKKKQTKNKKTKKNSKTEILKITLLSNFPSEIRCGATVLIKSYYNLYWRLCDEREFIIS